MCHGVSWRPRPKRVRGDFGYLTARRFDVYFSIAAEMGFESISYDDLNRWRNGEAEVPARPIMFDFDHPDHEFYDMTDAHSPYDNMTMNGV